MFVLDMSIARTAPGLGIASGQFVASREEQIEPAPFEKDAGSVTDQALHQAGVTLQMQFVTESLTLQELAKQAKGLKTDGAKQAARKVGFLLRSGELSPDAYAGEGTNFNPQKGTLTIGTNNVELAAKNLLATSKTEITQLKKDKSKTAGITALEAAVKADHSLGMYYTAVFKARNQQERIKAGKNLDGAIKALKVIKPASKGQELTNAQKAYLVHTLAIIQALANKSGTVLTQQALLAQLKQSADGKKTGTVDELAKDLITKAEQAASVLKETPKATPASVAEKQRQRGPADNVPQFQTPA